MTESLYRYFAEEVLRAEPVDSAAAHAGRVDAVLDHRSPRRRRPRASTIPSRTSFGRLRAKTACSTRSRAASSFSIRSSSDFLRRRLEADDPERPPPSAASSSTTRRRTAAGRRRSTSHSRQAARTRPPRSSAAPPAAFSRTVRAKRWRSGSQACGAAASPCPAPPSPGRNCSSGKARCQRRPPWLRTQPGVFLKPTRPTRGLQMSQVVHCTSRPERRAHSNGSSAHAAPPRATKTQRKPSGACSSQPLKSRQRIWLATSMSSNQGIARTWTCACAWQWVATGQQNRRHRSQESGTALLSCSTPSNTAVIRSHQPASWPWPQPPHGWALSTREASCLPTERSGCVTISFRPWSWRLLAPQSCRGTRSEVIRHGAPRPEGV